MHSRNGRPLGRVGEKTLNARRWARSIVETDWYHQLVEDRLRAGTCPPAVEVLLLQYAYGHPRQAVDMTVTALPDLRGRSREELLARYQQLVEQVHALPPAADEVDIEQDDTEPDAIDAEVDDQDPIN